MILFLFDFWEGLEVSPNNYPSNIDILEWSGWAYDKPICFYNCKFVKDSTKTEPFNIMYISLTKE